MQGANRSEFILELVCLWTYEMKEGKAFLLPFSYN